MASLSYLSKMIFVAILAAIGSFYAGFHVGSEKVVQLELHIESMNAASVAKNDLIVSMSEVLRDLMIDLTYGDFSSEMKQELIKSIHDISSAFGELG